MRIITGDETGLLKSTSLEAQRIVVAGAQSRSRAIRALCWAQGATVYAAARQDGVVTLWEDADKAPRLLKELKGAVGPDVVGMAACGAAGDEERILVGHGGGRINVLAPFGGSAGPAPDAAGGWEVAGPLSCMAVAGATVAAGGKERELGLWDASTGQAVWEARNVPHDKLDLRQPVWVTAASFLDGAGAQRTVAIGTAYKQVRIYDARAQRRPVRQTELAEGYRVTALCAGLEPGAQLVVGDAGGTVLQLDAGSLRVLGRMEGPAGSVRGLARHPGQGQGQGQGQQPFVAVAGLDRMARVYDLRRPRKEAFRFYLKQRLTAVLFAPEGRRGSKGRADAEATRRARAAAAGLDEDEIEAMEDDVASFGDGGRGADDSSDSDSDSEEEEEGETAMRGGKRKASGGGSGGGVSSQRIYDQASSQEESEGDEDGDGDGDDEEDEPVLPFGRRGSAAAAAAAANIELNVVGGAESDSSMDDGEEADEEDEEDEDEDGGESSGSEEDEEEAATPRAGGSMRARRR